MLDATDQEEEAGLLGEACERLISAYQEARELSDEMEGLVKDALINQLKTVSRNKTGAVKKTGSVWMRRL